MKREEEEGAECCGLLLCSIVKLTNGDKIKISMTRGNRKA